MPSLINARVWNSLIGDELTWKFCLMIIRLSIGNENRVLSVGCKLRGNGLVNWSLSLYYALDKAWRKSE